MLMIFILLPCALCLAPCALIIPCHQPYKCIIKVRVLPVRACLLYNRYRTAGGDYLALIYHGNPPAITRLIHVMGGYKHGYPLKGQVLDELPEMPPGYGINP